VGHRRGVFLNDRMIMRTFTVLIMVIFINVPLFSEIIKKYILTKHIDTQKNEIWYLYCEN